MDNWLRYDMGSKTCEEGCTLAKQLHRCVQAPKLEKKTLAKANDFRG